MQFEVIKQPSYGGRLVFEFTVPVVCAINYKRI
jgi:hypothetical protein